MSKYTDAIEVLKRNKPTSDPRECGRELCNAVDVAIKALQIADRLEQADAEKHSDDWFIRDDNSEFDRGYSIGFEEGYNTALADIRGDNNDGV